MVFDLDPALIGSWIVTTCFVRSMNELSYGLFSFDLMCVLLSLFSLQNLLMTLLVSVLSLQVLKLFLLRKYVLRNLRVYRILCNLSGFFESYQIAVSIQWEYIIAEVGCWTLAGSLKGVPLAILSMLQLGSSALYLLVLFRMCSSFHIRSGRFLQDSAFISDNDSRGVQRCWGCWYWAWWACFSTFW